MEKEKERKHRETKILIVNNYPKKKKVITTKLLLSVLETCSAQEHEPKTSFETSTDA